MGKLVCVWSPLIRGRYSWPKKDVRIVAVKAVQKRMKKSSIKVIRGK
jgi:hypothetical protein